MSSPAAVTLNETDHLLLRRLLLAVSKISKYGSEASADEAKLVASILAERFGVMPPPVVELVGAAA